ncbi:caspase-2 isoform X1 [Gadus chalcogrammus]|uniref:caspase-2 isoform X1 n=1 Tax=Gadus chalcogrammus TaxID=1042646 RepID=UPI0024C4DED8|nr:caspase-2 isoform X1 [Gadus chalcogrammus]XP_056458589.1 caspase-2 isoform X1 [Gadus chalcogrammus]
MLQCGMSERDKRTLRKLSAVLCKQMVVDAQLVQSLQADEILNDEMAESVLNEKTSGKQNWRLLFLLPKRGPGAFNSFCSALRDTEQHHLCDLIEKHSTSNSKLQPERDTQVLKTYPDEISELQRFVEAPLPHPTQEAIAAKRQRTHDSMETSLDTDCPITTPVLPCTQEFYLTRCKQSYRMCSSPRGCALVISNVTFDSSTAPDLDHRKGGEVDEEVLRKVFTELDFVVSVHRNLTAQAMRECIEQFCQLPEHRTADSSVVCLLSHGVDGAVYSTDGELLQLDWVFEAFDNSHCPLLQNKPKMFFVQACRGEEMDCGVVQTDGPERTGSPSCEQRDAGREGEGDPGSRRPVSLGRPRIKLPQRSDMICGFASLKGQRLSTAAMRNTKRGSWFVQELNEALRLRSRDTHLADILVQVNARIKEREGFAPGTPHHRCKEMSEFTSSLCNDLFLFPKYQHRF